jgi:hypothetical protein
VAIIAKDNRKEFTPAPEGLHQAVCVDVIDLGLQQTPWGEKHKVDVRWELEVTGDNGRPMIVSKRYTLSLNEKATLRQHLEAWRGRKFKPEELEGFDLEKLLGVNGQLQIVHNIADDGRIFANVQAIVPLGKGMTKMRPSDDYVRMVDRAAASNGSDEVHHAGDADDAAVPF